MKLIMISAAFENGGNVFQRHLDGHPDLLVYPFESQIGTKLSDNCLSSLLHYRYRYPVFAENVTPLQAYHAFYDEELKCYLRTPDRSKFRNCGLMMDENKRIEYFIEFCRESIFQLGRVLFIEAYFYSTFGTWENLNTNYPSNIVGYLPGMMESDKLFNDFPDAHIIHIIRNPLSAFSDYLKRPYAGDFTQYCATYNIIHHLAYNYQKKYPNNFHIIRYEDFIKEKRKTLEPILQKIGIRWDNSLLYPSFNGKELRIIKPWGSIEEDTISYNINAINKLSFKQISDVMTECSLIRKIFYPDA